MIEYPSGLAVLNGDIAVAVRENADVHVGLRHIADALREGTAALGDVVLHAYGEVLGLAEALGDRRSVGLEIFEGRGDIDPVHIPLLSGSDIEIQIEQIEQNMMGNSEDYR